MSRYLDETARAGTAAGQSSTTTSLDLVGYVTSMSSDLVITAVLFWAATRFAPAGPVARPLVGSFIIVVGKGLVTTWMPKSHA